MQTEIATDNNPLALQQAVNQLEEYFEESRKTLNLTLQPQETQIKKMWQQFTTISFGEKYLIKKWQII